LRVIQYKMGKITRREFNLLTTKVIASITLYQFIGCTDEVKLISKGEENLKKLVIAFGPWPMIDRSIAEDFANRFIEVSHLSQNYLKKSVELVNNIANKLPKNAIALESLDLRKFSFEENEFILTLCKQLYNLVEVRYYISKMPQFGECQVDALFYTKSPS